MSRHEPCECGVCQVRHFERNNYYHGKALTVRDLTAEQDYFNEKRRLLNRTTLGWGIVCGLETCLHGDCVVVEPGLAIDCCGRELLVCERQGLSATRIAEALKVDPAKGTDGIRWVLCLEYDQCRTEQVSVPRSCDQEGHGSEYNRIREGFRLVARRFDDECHRDHDESCCPYPGLGTETSIQRALYERSLKCPACRDCECVVLTTGTLTAEPNEPPQVALEEEAWKYRRTVYTNGALASLLQCFHPNLPHITHINWDMNRQYSAAAFLDLLTNNHLLVTYDREMELRTVTKRRTCRLSIYLPSGNESCLKQVLIPVRNVEYANKIATYHFHHECLERELHSCKSAKHPVDVELILHGGMILDEKGHALDAELIDGKFPTGNGVRGGEFIAYFNVQL